MGSIKNLLIKNNVLFPLSLKIQNLFYKLFSNNTHQISNFTLYNRYPILFDFAKSYFESHKQKELKILCYGCSSGEECFSLNEYFKEAVILGVDNNNKVLSKARKTNRFPNITFAQSTTENLVQYGPFDLIFAMAVFCRWPASNFYKDLSHIYPFKRFEESINELDKHLNKNGLLIFNNSNYLLSDTSIYSHYEVLQTPQGVEKDVVPKFSKNNLYLGLIADTDIIFRKLT